MRKRRARRRYDVEGQSVLYDRLHATLRAVSYRVRCDEDGTGWTTVNGLTYPIRADMTVAEYLEFLFGKACGFDGDARAAGD